MSFGLKPWCMLMNAARTKMIKYDSWRCICKNCGKQYPENTAFNVSKADCCEDPIIHIHATIKPPPPERWVEMNKEKEEDNLTNIVINTNKYYLELSELYDNNKIRKIIIDDYPEIQEMFNN